MAEEYAKYQRTFRRGLSEYPSSTHCGTHARKPEASFNILFS
jgi:hypothetical protein